MLLKVISTKLTCDNIQISQFSSKHTKLKKGVGKFVLVPRNEVSCFVCKVLTSQETHPAYVELDKSVVHFKERSLKGFPNLSLSFIDEINDLAIEFLPTPSSTKSVAITVVLHLNLPKPNTIFTHLSSSVKDILKLFVFMKDSVIFLDSISNHVKQGIYLLVIDSMTCDNNNSIGYVSSKTSVTINNVISRKYFEEVVGYSSVPKRNLPREPHLLLKSIIDLRTNLEENSKSFIMPPQMVIITGLPGSGKSTLVSSVAAEAGATLVHYSNYSKTSGNHPENLKSCFSEAVALAEERAEGMCILLLKNLDLICKRRDTGNISVDNLSSSLQLMTLLEEVCDKPHLLIVATTSKLHHIDPTVRQFFNFEIIIEQSEDDREHILRSLLYPLTTNFSTLANEVAHMTPGYVAADLALIIHKVACINNDRPLNGLEEWLHELKTSIAETKPSTQAGALGALKKKLRISQQLGGLFLVKEQLRATIEEPLTNPQAYARLGLPLPKGVLLFGPPGCAKTSLVHEIASTLPVTFLCVSSADLYSPFVGEAEENIVDLFRRARCSAPAILFIDELDALVGSRNGQPGGVQSRVLSAFLMEMDGISVHTTVSNKKAVAENTTETSEMQTLSDFEAKSNDSTVIVIGATNRPDFLDGALRRPGRFDKLIHVPAPDMEERLDILRGVTSNMALNSDVDLRSLARQTELCSGADLAHLCTTAALSALATDGMSVADVQMRHFESTLKDMKPSLSSDQIDWYYKFSRGANDTLEWYRDCTMKM